MPPSEPAFHPIDPARWSRQPYFDHYYHAVRCDHSTTVAIDVSELLARCRLGGIRFYPAMIHIIATAVNSIETLRTGFDGQGVLGQWDVVSPLYAVFHNGNKTFSNLWTAYNPCFAAFLAAYREDMALYGERPEFFPKPTTPDNVFPVSCLPWVNFTSFNLNLYGDGAYLKPVVTIGQYTETAGKTSLPVALQAHHALCDGYHVGAFFSKVASLASSAGDWLAG